ncbi:hypothetical protein C8R41DRAFT_863982 [Lentinula lateritia]|uniref:Uncharacterized protein n=1 Tax=Lentinula lateritia TaxID=40482 RepID=A0ABQ8VVX6_9AGAR|nr:hypothetical protein C8R41DRAFT_863982 [Lentinula lateritia]
MFSSPNQDRASSPDFASNMAGPSKGKQRAHPLAHSRDQPRVTRAMSKSRAFPNTLDPTALNNIPEEDEHQDRDLPPSPTGPHSAGQLDRVDLTPSLGHLDSPSRRLAGRVGLPRLTIKLPGPLQANRRDSRHRHNQTSPGRLALANPLRCLLSPVATSTRFPCGERLHAHPRPSEFRTSVPSSGRIVSPQGFRWYILHLALTLAVFLTLLQDTVAGQLLDLNLVLVFMAGRWRIWLFPVCFWAMSTARGGPVVLRRAPHHATVNALNPPAGPTDQSPPYSLPFSLPSSSPMIPGLFAAPTKPLSPSIALVPTHLPIPIGQVNFGGGSSPLHNIWRFPALLSRITRGGVVVPALLHVGAVALPDPREQDPTLAVAQTVRILPEVITALRKGWPEHISLAYFNPKMVCSAPANRRHSDNTVSLSGSDLRIKSKDLSHFDLARVSTDDFGEIAKTMPKALEAFLIIDKSHGRMGSDHAMALADFVRKTFQMVTNRDDYLEYSLTGRTIQNSEEFCLYLTNPAGPA